MEENKLNEIGKKMFGNLEFEKPSNNFTETLMLKIERAKNAQKANSKTSFGKKFMFIFIFTFSSITILSYLLKGTRAASDQPGGIFEKFKLDTYNLDFFSKYLNINFDFGFIAKLVVGSIIILIIIDLASGSLIDRILDSKTRKENRM